MRSSQRVIMAIMIFVLTHCCGLIGQAQTKTPLDKRADDIAALFRENPAGYQEIFSKEFLTNVPPDKITALVNNFYGQLGRCVEVKLTKLSNATMGKYEFIFEKGFSVPVTLGINETAPYLVSTLFLGNPVHLAATINELLKDLQALPGETSFLAVRLKDDGIEKLGEFNSERPLAIGSAFKLYVLSELIRSIKAGNRKWTDTVTLRGDAISLPSGILQNWPIGAPLTVHTLASLMISMSDNTATDQLIRTIGRENIEKNLANAGHSKPELNIPFFTTLELFKLKTDPAGKLPASYAGKDAKARREMLDGSVAAMSKENLNFGNKPAYIDSLEWFASAADLCRVMNWLRKETASAPEGRAILAINPGIRLSDKQWQYIGFKGGSEPGVLNLTMLLQSVKGDWYAISVGWNNKDAEVDQAKLLGIVERATQLMQ